MDSCTIPLAESKWILALCCKFLTLAKLYTLELLTDTYKCHGIPYAPYSNMVRIWNMVRIKVRIRVRD